MIEAKGACLCACEGSEFRDMGLIMKWKYVQTKTEHSLEPHINGYPKESQGRIIYLELIKKHWNSLCILYGKHNICQTTKLYNIYTKSIIKGETTWKVEN